MALLSALPQLVEFTRPRYWMLNRIDLQWNSFDWSRRQMPPN